MLRRGRLLGGHRHGAADGDGLMARAAYVYHDGYDLQFGDHVFPTMKYKLIYQRMIAEGLASEGDFHRPEEASDDDLELVHTSDWVRKLKTGTLTYAEIL